MAKVTKDVPWQKLQWNIVYKHEISACYVHGITLEFAFQVVSTLLFNIYFIRGQIHHVGHEKLASKCWVIVASNIV